MRLIRLLVLITIYTIITNASAKEKSEIINKLNYINNIQFKFTQKTNEKIEKGKCILSFPNKLKCDYEDKDQKELIVNKTMMAITQKRYGKTFFYPLSKSTFIKVLNKIDLIKMISESNIIVDNYINAVFIDRYDNKTSIRFDKETFLLAGWVSSDQYNNQIIFEIKISSINQTLNEKIFMLPNKG